MTNLTNTHATTRSLWFSPFAALRAWLDVRQTERALSQLSDRELKDIGLCRNDIYHIARNPNRRTD